MRAASRGTSRRRRPTEQVISPPAPGPGLGKSRRALTQVPVLYVLPRYLPRGPPDSHDFRCGLYQGTYSLLRPAPSFVPQGRNRIPVPSGPLFGRFQCPTSGFWELLLPGSAIIAIPLPVHHSPTYLCSSLSLDGGIPCSPQCPWYF